MNNISVITQREQVAFNEMIMR